MCVLHKAQNVKICCNNSRVSYSFQLTAFPEGNEEAEWLTIIVYYATFTRGLGNVC